jgi:hypothetical protein
VLALWVGVPDPSRPAAGAQAQQQARRTAGIVAMARSVRLFLRQADQAAAPTTMACVPYASAYPYEVVRRNVAWC